MCITVRYGSDTLKVGRIVLFIAIERRKLKPATSNSSKIITTKLREALRSIQYRT